METSKDPVTFLGHEQCQANHKRDRDIWVIKLVTTTSDDPVTFWGDKLGQTDQNGHHDLWGLKGSHDDH